MTSQFPVLVIGAGPAGLAAMHALGKRNISFEGVESTDDVGGLWNPHNPDSPAYDSLHTNSSKATTHLGEQMPSDWPAYPSKNHAFTYLKNFADQYDLRSKIVFQTEVTTLRKGEDETWIATLKRSQGQNIERPYRAVIVATGTYNKKNRVVPDELWNKSKQAGLEVLHASEYRNTHSFHGKNVLIVGMGNSAAEIATELCTVAKSTTISVRTSPWIVPLWTLGKPADVIAQGVRLPYRITLALFHVLQRWYVGHPRKLGLPSPQHGLLDYLPISDRGISQALRQKKIRVRGRCKDILNDGVVVFEGIKGSNESGTDVHDRFDAIIFATGYQRQFAFLPKELGVGSQGPSVSYPYLIFHATEPGLLFMTEIIVAQSAWAIYAEQAEVLAAYLHATEKGPVRYQDFNQRHSWHNPDFKGPYFSKADGFHVDPKRYTSELKKFGKWISSLSPPIKKC